MKAKLLKKLRKKYQIQVRNSRYRVYENNWAIYNPRTRWFETLEKAIEVRREKILSEAKLNYAKPKDILKP